MEVSYAHVLVLLTAATFGQTYSEFIRIGGLFHTRDNLQEVSFRHAVDYVNSHKLVQRTRLVDQAERVPEFDSFQASVTVCELMGKGVAGIFGPQSDFTAPAVQAVCDVKGVPHIETRWNLRQKRNGPSINVHPHPTMIAKAVVDVVRAWGWTTFTILYQKEDNLAGISPLLKLNDSRSMDITVRQLGRGNNYREVLRDIKNSESNNIVLDCSVDILEDVLRQAQQVGLMVSEYSFIITSLDLHTIDLEPLQYGGTNITGFRMIDPEDPKVVSAVKRWTEGEARLGRVLEVTPQTMRLEAALIHDAVLLFARALNAYQDITVRGLNCESEDIWSEGDSLMAFMTLSTVRGLTGPVEFDHQGFRTNFGLELTELTGDGLVKIGIWNTTDGLNLTRIQQDATFTGDQDSLVNKTFIVLIALTDPYGMLKDDIKQLTGNDRYEGFGIDLIQELSIMLGFNYTFHVQQDNNYGSLNKVTKKWNGMMKELMDWRADLAITDLTITHDRESAVDFTMPFMTLGISILFKKPQKEPPSLFSFLSPFSNEVWMYMLGAYLGVSVLLFFMARISPYEWTNPYPCIEEPEELENQFSLKNSLWFTIGSLMQQGSEIAPIAVSTRMVAGIWWFFTLIMVSSYTANLAAFLTVESTSSAFRNVEELANQKVIKYGAKKGGSTASFFMDSTHGIYGKMGAFMGENLDVLTSSNQEGIDKVMNEDYAYFMESTSIEYTTERNCKITQVGGLLDSKGYGIAMRKNSSYRNALSTGVLRLQETGKLTQLKRKWWKEKKGGGACEDDEGGGEASELGLDNVGGVFVVLVAGVFIACFITVCEMLWNIGEISRKEKVAFKEELMEELKFVAKCHGSTKPVRKRNAPDESGDEEGEFQRPAGTTNYGWFLGEDRKSPLE